LKSYLFEGKFRESHTPLFYHLIYDRVNYHAVDLLWSSSITEKTSESPALAAAGSKCEQKCALFVEVTLSSLRISMLFARREKK